MQWYVHFQFKTERAADLAQLHTKGRDRWGDKENRVCPPLQVLHFRAPLKQNILFV